MLLYLALALTGFGFVAFIAGNLLGMPGIGVIGAVIVVGIGSMVTTTGLQYRDGETVEKVYGADGNVEREEVQPVERDVDTPTHLSLGVLWMLLGGGMTLRGINRTREGT